MIKCSKRFNFILGERRKVIFELFSEDGTGEFIIMNANYVLANEDDEEDRVEGQCTIDNHTVVCTICPAQIGTYLLTVACEVGDEIIKETAEIYVDLKRG